MFNRLPKPILFGIFAAIGCLIGAILGEFFLKTTQLPSTPPPPHDVVLLIDTSGSMAEGTKLQEVQAAAIQFIQRRHDLAHLANNKIAVVGFGGWQAYIVANLTNDLMSLQPPIQTLRAVGGTPMDRGLQLAMKQLSAHSDSEQQSILLFTDGKPSNQQATLNASQAVKNTNIQIVAIATDDADTALLTQVTGDAALVFPTSVGNFDQAFQKAEQAIYQHDLVTANPVLVTEKSLAYSLFRIGAWTALLALGIGLALVIGQNFYLRRRLLTPREGLIVSLGCILVGFIAGGIGQLLYGITSDATTVINFLNIVTRIVAWSLLGILLGIGISFFIPNLKLIKASQGGLLGGAIGVIGFLFVAYYIADEIVPRLLGAMILGFCIGIFLGMAELARKAWLEVRWGPKDVSTITLGEQPILVGSSDKAHVYLPKNQNFPMEVGTISMKGDQITFDNYMTGETQILKHGNKWTIATVTIEVKTAQ
jgi:Ca-activated chloride channel homolog